MTTTSITSAAKLAAVLAMALGPGEGTPGWRAERVTRDVLRLRRLAWGITRREVAYSNNPETEAQEARRLHLNAKAYQEAKEIAARYGATMKPMSDVRGFAITLIWPSWPDAPSNSFTGRGWGL